MIVGGQGQTNSVGSGNFTITVPRGRWRIKFADIGMSKSKYGENIRGLCSIYITQQGRRMYVLHGARLNYWIPGVSIPVDITVQEGDTITGEVVNGYENALFDFHILMERV